MKLEISLSAPVSKELAKLVAEWKELSPYPLTHVERLQNLEKEIAKQLTYALLSDNAFEALLNHERQG
jgi:hypothetical protein